MSLQNKIIQRDAEEFSVTVKNRATETSIYITDLLGELQTIAQIGGLMTLADDLELVLVKHMSGQSIL